MLTVLTVLAIALIAIGAGTYWLYRGSAQWPTAQGIVEGLDVEYRSGTTHGAAYYHASFTYCFSGPDGNRYTGTWDKNFSSDNRQFAERALPNGKIVVIRSTKKILS